MSDLPADELTYETVIAEYFLGLRGAGLMLSPLDVELVRAWKHRGIPVPVVCRGLRFGYERALATAPPSGAPPRSVRALRLAVEDEWRAYRASRVTPTDAREDVPGDVAAQARAAAALCDAAALCAWDAAALRAWSRGLSPVARRALGRFCALRAGPRARGCTRAAHRAALLAHAKDFSRGAGLTLVAGTV